MMHEAWGVLTHGGLGLRNRQAVLREIVLDGPLSRTGIAARTGLTIATVSRITRGLLGRGLIRELPDEREDADMPGPGRRSIYLDTNPRGGQVLGIAIGHTFHTITLADLGNQVIASTEIDLDALDDPDRVIDRVAGESRRLIAAHIEDRSRLFGGFVMVPGRADPTRGIVLNLSCLEGWDNVPLGPRLTELLGLPMRVRCYATSSVLAETCLGVARGRSDVLAVSSGLGVSIGLILNGRITGNAQGRIGAASLMPVAGRDGVVTRLDRLATGFGVLRHLHGDDFDLSMLSVNKRTADALRDVIDRDRNADPAVAAPMAETGRTLGRLIAQFARLVTPEIVVIGGPLSLSPRYLAAAREGFFEWAGDTSIEVVPGTAPDSISGQWAPCGLAICEHLFGLDSELPRPGRPIPPARGILPPDARRGVEPAALR